MVLGEWNDGRLNDLSKRVERIDEQVTPLLTIVARQDQKLDGLVVDMHSLSSSIEAVHRDVKDMRAEPLKRARSRRDQIIAGCIAALFGGLFVLIAAAIGHIA